MTITLRVWDDFGNVKALEVIMFYGYRVSGGRAGAGCGKQQFTLYFMKLFAMVWLLI